jgi:hypothetical protein
MSATVDPSRVYTADELLAMDEDARFGRVRRVPGPAGRRAPASTGRPTGPDYFAP